MYFHDFHALKNPYIQLYKYTHTHTQARTEIYENITKSDGLLTTRNIKS